MIQKPSAGDTSELEWFKSSYSSSGDGNDCVEVATAPGAVHVRDSKNAQGGHGAFAEAADLGVIAVATPTPTAQTLAPERDAHSRTCTFVQDHHPTAVPVRDSKVPGGPALLFPAAGWSAFVTAVPEGSLQAGPGPRPTPALRPPSDQTRRWRP